MKKNILLPFAFLLLPFMAIPSDAKEIAQTFPSATVTRQTLRPGSQGTEVAELQAALKLLGYYNGDVNGVYGENTAIAVSRFQQAAGLAPDGIVGAETWKRLFPVAPPSESTAAATPLVIPSPSASTISTTGAASFPVPTTTNTAANPRPAATSRPSVNVPASNSPATTARTPNRPATAARTTANRSTTAAPSSQTRTNPQQPRQLDFPVLRLGTQGPAVTSLQQRLRTLGFFKGTVNGVFGETTQTAVKAAQQRFKLDADGVVGPATWNVLLR
ncbi:peptidoglycan-binding protein [Coleofasciculus sp. FACHB-64]|uniref:peptidoglycan-binding protein n=1 Tax=Cyanophyceae TaxID=3028117 RepID=UPI0016851E46|nr:MULTISPECIES: peptidoglycan-binding protein [unclassified Coleofasciculus]MBD1838096.1 peptidoglycan-binding protein [Coleofasciculus sp. FACHB-501]MBD2046210.1 peptidoglycan-binding protein [Coleofasciculus sp. FACHB-64]